MADRKPEWFVLTENDRPQKRSRVKSKKSLRPVIAFAISGLVIGAGSIFAGADDDGGVSANSSSQTSATSVAAPALQNGDEVQAPANSTTTLSPAQGGGVANPMTGAGRGDTEDEFNEHEGEGPGHEFRSERNRHHDDGEREEFERERR